MVRNEEKYKQAVEFRKRGFTYSEIAKICDISKSTVSSWLSAKKFSMDVKSQNQKRARRDNKKRIALLQKARTGEWQRRYREAERSAEVEFKHYKANPLFMAGLVVYLTHGDVSHETSIRLSSNRIIPQQLFVAFAREFLGINNDQLHVWMILHPKHSEAVCVKKWSRSIKFSAADFGKTQFVGSKGKDKPLHFGTLNTIIGNTVLKRKLNRWLELSTKELIKK